MVLHMPSDCSQAASWTGGESNLRRDRLDIGADYVEPNGELELWLADVWRELLNVDRIGALDDFFELGGNSFQASELFLRIEQRTGVRLAHSTIIDHPTVARLAALLGGAKDSLAGRCLVPMRSDGAGPPLFLVHEVSGQVLAYRHLVKRLGAQRKIYGLQFPGHERPPFPLLSIPEMAATYVSAIRELQPRGPYFLAGYSLGGQIVYEMAHQISADGSEIGLLAAIDSVPARSSKLRGPRRVARKLSRHLALLSDLDPIRWPGHILGTLRKELRRRRAAPVRQAGSQPANRPLELIEFLYDQHARYVPPSYTGPLKVLRCMRNGSAWNAQSLGWADHAKGPVEIGELPGDHTAIMFEPIVALVAAYLDRWLAEADATAPPARGAAA